MTRADVEDLIPSLAFVSGVLLGTVAGVLSSGWGVAFAAVLVVFSAWERYTRKVHREALARLGKVEDELAKIKTEVDGAIMRGAFARK